MKFFDLKNSSVKKSEKFLSGLKWCLLSNFESEIKSIFFNCLINTEEKGMANQGKHELFV